MKTKYGNNDVMKIIVVFLINYLLTEEIIFDKKKFLLEYYQKLA